MWIIRLKIKHDCTIGNRCRKFNCTCFSLPLSHWKEKNYYFISQRHTIEGRKEAVNQFLKELYSDPRIINLEVSKNTLFFVEKRKALEIPAAHYNPRMFFVQPVFVDKKGFEYWELASWKKEILMQFMQKLQKVSGMKIILEKFQKAKLDTIYFPKILPKLSEKQREAFQLAVEEGYYRFPRKIEMQQLAELMKVSTSTYQEHLRRAEQKIMPTYV